MMASLKTSKLKQEERNWLDLPTDVTANILGRVGMVHILENAQKVCTAWYKLCKDPALWRVVNMNDLPRFFQYATKMCKHAVDRSQGQLVDFTSTYDHNANLLLYVADRSSQLRRLEIVSADILFNIHATKALMKFPLLEELNFYATSISKQVIEIVGRYCPVLRTLKMNVRQWPGDSDVNEVAVAIGHNLVKLTHLELIGNNMTNSGLQVILDNCHHLETLDLRACYNIDLTGDLGKKCSEQIKFLKLPKDSLKGCPYFDEIASEPYDEDYYYYDSPEVSYDDCWISSP